MYQVIKHFHLLTVTISVSLLCIRFGLMLKDSPLLQRKFFRIAPHINDTFLLLSGVVLIFITGFIPFTPAAPWLTEKLFCVVAYIVLGFFALKYGRNKWLRSLAFLGALGWIAMIGYLAESKLPVFM